MRGDGDVARLIGGILRETLVLLKGTVLGGQHQSFTKRLKFRRNDCKVAEHHGSVP